MNNEIKKTNNYEKKKYDVMIFENEYFDKKTKKKKKDE